jgi:hypothetical protein
MFGYKSKEFEGKFLSLIPRLKKTSHTAFDDMA